MDIIHVILFFLVLAIIFTILLVHSVPAWTCAASLAPKKEGFTGNLPEVKSCPYSSSEFIDRHDNILCCDGKVEGRECMGEVLCRFSPASGPDSPAFCADYVANQSFKASSSLIQNPDTDMCLSPKKIRNIDFVLASKCNGSDVEQHWTYNKLGQIVHDKSGKCITQGNEFIYNYKLEVCQLKDTQIFKYDYKTNQIFAKSTPESPIFLQNSQGILPKDSQDKYIPYTVKADAEMRAFFNNKMGDDELKNIKDKFLSDSGKSERTTFFSVKPTMQDVMKNINSMYNA